MAVEINNNELQVQRLREIIRYRKDPVAFLKEQCQIKHPRKGVIPFTLFPAQETCVKDFMDYRFNIVLKSRQLGITTVVAGFCCWRMIFFPHQEIRVVATKNETAQISIEMANTMIDNVAPWILAILGSTRANERKHTVELLNGSRMSAFGQSRGSNPDTGVGRALSLLVVDEAALIPNMTDIWTSVYPTLSQGGNAIVLSTPRGSSNWFYDTYRKAEDKDYKEGEIAFNPIRLMWWENTERMDTPLEADDTVPGGYVNHWARGTFAALSIKQIAQEYSCVTKDCYVSVKDREGYSHKIEIGQLEKFLATSDSFIL